MKVFRQPLAAIANLLTEATKRFITTEATGEFITARDLEQTLKNARRTLSGSSKDEDIVYAPYDPRVSMREEGPLTKAQIDEIVKNETARMEEESKNIMSLNNPKSAISPLSAKQVDEFAKNKDARIA